MGLQGSESVKHTCLKAPALAKGAQSGLSENENLVQHSAGGQIKYPPSSKLFTAFHK